MDMRRTFVAIFFSALSSFLLAQQSKKEWVLATYTYSTNTRMENLKPLAAYLSKKTGLTIKAVSYPSVAALLEAINKDSVDFAMMNTSGYLVQQRKTPGKIIPMVNLEMGSGAVSNYGGCIIANKSLSIQSLEQLINTNQKLSLALVAASSTSGNLVPRLLLNKTGIANAEQYFQLYYNGTHRGVVQDVINGKAMLGGCGCAEVDTAKARFGFDEKAVLIAEYNNTPLGPVVYQKSTPQKIVRKIRKELLTVHERSPDTFVKFCAGWTEFKQATRFKSVSDKEYDSFRALFGNNESLWRMIE